MIESRVVSSIKPLNVLLTAAFANVCSECTCCRAIQNASQKPLWWSDHVMIRFTGLRDTGSDLSTWLIYTQPCRNGKTQLRIFGSFASHLGQTFGQLVSTSWYRADSQHCSRLQWWGERDYLIAGTQKHRSRNLIPAAGSCRSIRSSLPASISARLSSL
jgi:hypothetical protein